MSRCHAVAAAALLGALLGSGSFARAEEQSAEEQRLETAHLKLDNQSLLHLFRKRTLADKDLDQVRAVIRKLGAASFREREHAVADLVSRGPVVIELLKQALKDADLEVTRRAQRCIQRIKEKDEAAEALPAAARLLARRKPAGAVEVLLAYLPFADSEEVADEIRTTLSTLAVHDGQADPALVAALTDSQPIRRAAAAEALSRANIADQKTAVRRLLHDSQPEVRLRVSLALAYRGDRDAIPVIIDALPDLPQVLAWQGEDVLLRLAEGRRPPFVSLGPDQPARRRARDAWTEWWKTNSSTVEIARLRTTPPLLGYTLIVLLDEGQVIELGKDNQPRWEVKDLLFPLDAQSLPDNRVLVAEYQASKVTERNHKGEILWEQPVDGPLMAQRLPDGNTFIGTTAQLLEVDRNHKVVFSHVLSGREQIMKATKTTDGDIVCLTTEPRIVRLDSTGKELSSFSLSLGKPLHGGRIDVLPGGRVLVPHNAENKVVEYDASGKELWKVSIDQPVAAVRLANGNTLVTTLNQNRAVEFDRDGREVWQYRTKTRVTRAFRR
jgi:hypothetical protein